jgi:hypothetical protein
MASQLFFAQRQHALLDDLSSSQFGFEGSQLTASSAMSVSNVAGGLTLQTQGVNDTISFQTNSGLVDVSAQTLLVETVPTAVNSAVSKAYVDAAIAGIAVKQSCAARVTTELDGLYAAAGSKASKTLTGNASGAFPMIDGHPISEGDRVVVDLGSSAHNGIYVLTRQGSVSVSWQLSRAPDFNGVASPGNASNQEVQGGSYTLIRFGTENGGREYAVQTGGVIDVDVTAFAWVQINNAATHTSGNSGIVISGNAISVSAALQSFNTSAIAIGGSTLSIASASTAAITLDCMSLSVSNNYQASSSASTLVPKSYVDNAIAIAAPVGHVVAYGGIAAPAGWVACDGSASLSRSGYPALFAALSYTTALATISAGSTAVVLSGSDGVYLQKYVGAAIDSGANSGLSGATIVSVSAIGAGSLVLSAPASAGGSMLLYVMPFGAANNSTFSPPDLRGEVIRGWASGGALDAGRAFGSVQAGSQVASSLGDANSEDASTPWIVENDFVKNADSTQTYSSVPMYSPALAYYGPGSNPKASLSRSYDSVRMANVAMLYIMKSS